MRIAQVADIVRKKKCQGRGQEAGGLYPQRIQEQMSKLQSVDGKFWELGFFNMDENFGAVVEARLPKRL